MSQRDPVGRCRFCGYLYYTWKLPVHEAVCSRRASRFIGLPAPPFMLRELTEKQRRLIAELEKGPKRFTDLLRCRLYGNRGLAMALADLHIEGLVDKDENQGYELTKEGRKQALRERVVRAIDRLLDGCAYEQAERRANVLLLTAERYGEKA